MTNTLLETQKIFQDKDKAMEGIARFLWQAKVVSNKMSAVSIARVLVDCYGEKEAAAVAQAVLNDLKKK